MNIYEAIRTGKPFRRTCMEHWYHYVCGEISCEDHSLDTTSVETLDSLLCCDDWEVQEKTIPITRDGLHLAMQACHIGMDFLNSEGSRIRTDVVWNRLIEQIKKGDGK